MTVDISSRPVVSMCCITYNQVNTIAQCLDGMLMQETDVPVEIVVHDDASTDGTADVVRRYMVEHPGRIRAILREENQFSQGRRPAALVFSEARGDYFALCEGDDFWTDPNKIATQLAVLEAEPGLDMCAHAVTIWEYEDGVKIDERISRDVEGHYDAGAVLERRGMLLPTASIFIRRAAAERFIDHVATRPWLTIGDLYLKFFGADRGGVRIIEGSLAVYRLKSVGSWSERSKKNSNHLIKNASAKLRSYRELAKGDASRFSEDINRTIIRSARYIVTNTELKSLNRLYFIFCNIKYIPSSAIPRLMAIAIVRH